MSNPLVSIIIPVYNRQELVKRTIQSILDQTYSNWECVFVDDGSTDNTVQTLKDYKETDNRFKILERNRLPKGPWTCRNIGFDNSQGRFVFFLDSDDVLDKHCIEQRVKHQMNSSLDPDSFVTVTKSQYFYDNGDKGPVWWFIDEDDFITGFMKKTSWGVSSTFWPRNIVKDFPFLENLKNGDDWNFHLSAIINGVKFKYLDTIDHYIYAGSSTRVSNSTMNYSNLIESNINNSLSILNHLKTNNQLTKERKNILKAKLFKSGQLAFESEDFSKYREIFAHLKDKNLSSNLELKALHRYLKHISSSRMPYNVKRMILLINKIIFGRQQWQHLL